MRVHNEAKDTVADKAVGMDYIALGNQLKLGKFTIEYDYKLSMKILTAQLL